MSRAFLLVLESSIGGRESWSYVSLESILRKFSGMSQIRMRKFSLEIADGQLGENESEDNSSRCYAIFLPRTRYSISRFDHDKWLTIPVHQGSFFECRENSRSYYYVCIFFEKRYAARVSRDFRISDTTPLERVYLFLTHRLAAWSNLLFSEISCSFSKDRRELDITWATGRT